MNKSIDSKATKEETRSRKRSEEMIVEELKSLEKREGTKRRRATMNESGVSTGGSLRDMVSENSFKKHLEVRFKGLENEREGLEP